MSMPINYNNIFKKGYDILRDQHQFELLSSSIIREQNFSQVESNTYFLKSENSKTKMIKDSILNIAHPLMKTFYSHDANISLEFEYIGRDYIFPYWQRRQSDNSLFSLIIPVIKNSGQMEYLSRASLYDNENNVYDYFIEKSEVITKGGCVIEYNKLMNFESRLVVDSDSLGLVKITVKGKG